MKGRTEWLNHLAFNNFAEQPKITIYPMKKFLVLTSMVILSMSSAFAACGKKVTSEGTLKSFDPATKALVVEAKDGKATTITLTPTTAGADAAAGLVGKSVKVVSEHGKADSVAAGA